MDAVRGACAWIRGLCRGLGCLFFLNLHPKRSKFDTSGLMSIDRGGGALRLLQWRIGLVL